MKAPAECNSIEEVRHEIDEIDRAIVEALGRRFAYVKAITRFKKTEADVRAPDRYQAVLAQRRLWAAEAGLDPAVIEEMYRLLIGHFIDVEMKDLHLSPSGTEPGTT
jgi:isochorismate pyruvate lyase